MSDKPQATARWRKSTHSNAQGCCVEVGVRRSVIAVRDSKDADGPMLTFSPTTWRAFLAALYE
jgi:hypothetical protein